ncbi:MAG: NifU family protein [Bacteroidota bacterium]
MSRKALLHQEGVPNPNAMKFVLENGILVEEPYEFSNWAEAEASPLARKLLMLRYVKRILLHQNAITVLKDETNSPPWDQILLEIRQMIQTHLDENEPILFMGAKQLAHQPSEEEIIVLIKKVLDRQIRPAAQADGGDIIFDAYENGVLNLSMHGACHRCPYAMQTMKEGVEKMMMSLVPEVRKVTARENGVVN